MKALKVCFVGIGSIAKRHIENLGAVCREKGIDLTIDAVSRGGRRAGAPFDVIQEVYTSVDAVEGVYDVIFITNPTEYHLDTLQVLADKGKHFFIEKPIASMHQLEQAKQVVCKPGSVYYVACPLRYTNVIQYVKEHIDPAEVVAVRSISSSYLPDWRPGVDYRETYSAHKDLGGGVSIDLIHEWDYLTYLFGEPETVHGLRGKHSDLEIDSEDFAIYIADYKDKTVELHLDYFGRKTIREMTLFTGEDTIVCDIANSEIKYLKSGKNIQLSEQRNDFQKKELQHFLSLIEKKETEASTGIAHAVSVLELSQK